MACVKEGKSVCVCVCERERERKRKATDMQRYAREAN